MHRRSAKLAVYAPILLAIIAAFTLAHLASRRTSAAPSWAHTIPLPPTGGLDVPESRDLTKRLQDPGLAAEDSREIVRRAAERALQSTPPLIEARREWASGVPLRVRVHPDLWMRGRNHRYLIVTPTYSEGTPLKYFIRELPPCAGDPRMAWDDDTYELPAPPSGATKLEFHLSVVDSDPTPQPLWTGALSLPVAVRPRVDDVLRPIRDQAVSRVVQDSINVGIRVDRTRRSRGGNYPPDRLGGDGDLVRLWTDLRADALPEGTARAFKVEILERAEVVAYTRFWYAPNLKGTPMWYCPCDLTGDQARLSTANPADPAWTVRVSGDPELALRDTSATSYWAGEFSIPLSAAELMQR